MSSETLSPMNIVVPPVHGALQDSPRRLLVDFFQQQADQGVRVLGGSSPKREPPEDDLGGKRKAVFFGVCWVKAVGQTVQGTPTGDFGLTDLGGASVHCQPMVGWKKTGTSCHERACIAVFSRSGRLV